MGNAWGMYHTLQDDGYTAHVEAYPKKLEMDRYPFMKKLRPYFSDSRIEKMN